MAAGAKLEFCPYLLPEFVFTGHELSRAGEVEIPPEYADYFRLIMDNPDIFPGFFHIDLENNVFPKLALLRKFGFYPERKDTSGEASPAPNGEIAAAPSSRLGPQEIATRAKA
jgi:hypothetical protein